MASDKSLLVSVLIPLADHRDAAERSIRAWCREQTLDRERYEVIVIAPTAFSEAKLARIRELLDERDVILTATARHDVALMAQAAARAAGEFLFFSESHVWPNPDVLERSLDRMQRHPDWAALVCGLKRVTVNRLGEVEADMYERDFTSGSIELGWRNINDAGFLTRRAPYIAAGGFDVALGHFAEWVLAARYATLGAFVAHCPDIVLWHLYPGNIGASRAFTEDFVRGEITYLARDPTMHGERLIQSPSEWSCRGDRRRDLAPHVVRLIAGEAAHALIERRPARVSWRLALKRIPIVLAGGAFERAAAAVHIVISRIALFVANQFQARSTLAAAFKRYIAAVIRRARLRWSDDFLARRRATESGELWSAFPDRGHVAAGLHDCETFGNVPFRWSEPVAAMGLDIAPGRYEIHIHMLWVQLADPSGEPEFYFNGNRVTNALSWNGGNTISFPVVVGSSRQNWLGWICPPTIAPLDRRLLGLPLVTILITPEDVR